MLTVIKEYWQSDIYISNTMIKFGVCKERILKRDIRIKPLVFETNIFNHAMAMWREGWIAQIPLN